MHPAGARVSSSSTWIGRVWRLVCREQTTVAEWMEGWRTLWQPRPSCRNKAMCLPWRKGTSPSYSQTASRPHNSSAGKWMRILSNDSSLQFGIGKAKQSSKHRYWTGTHQLDNGGGASAQVDYNSNKLQPCLNVGVHAINKTCFNSKTHIQPGYKNMNLLKYFQSRCYWCNKEESMVYSKTIVSIADNQEHEWGGHLCTPNTGKFQMPNWN